MQSLLETSNVSFQDLVGNGRSYLVPRFQRDYSWTEEQWENLWQDIVDLTPNRDKRHYMGAIVVQADGDDKFIIIDGQQRITTLSILALAVIHTLDHLEPGQGENAGDNKARARELRNRFIGSKDPASLMEYSKLKLNGVDDGFYQEHLVQLSEPLKGKTSVKSNRLLWECFEFFRKSIAAQFRDSSGEDLARFLSVTVANQLLFIRIRVVDEMSAFTVFETLNARGLELTTTDLVKNFLFSKVSTPSDLGILAGKWINLLESTTSEKFSEFLRYHFLTSILQVRTGRLFGMIKGEVKDGKDAFAFVDSLEPRAILFEALNDPSSSFWNDCPEVREPIRELKVLGVRQVTPLQFVAHEHFNTRNFNAVLQMLVAISFRYTTISGLNPSELERVYSQGCIAITSGEAKTPKELFSFIKAVYVPDAKFKANFEALDFGEVTRKKRLVKYILSKIEGVNGNHRTALETDTATIEHVLPLSPSEAWPSEVDASKWAELAEKLGNLTLLEGAMNRELGNSSFEAKCLAYAKSKYTITSDIAKTAFDEWGEAQIEKRQKNLAKLACQAWRCDF